MDMGRPKKYQLPPKMTARTLKSGKVLYYYQSGGKKIPLGSDLIAAKKEWLKLDTPERENGFRTVAERYRKEALPLKSYKTQKDQDGQLDHLIEAYKEFSLDDIEPQHVRQYLDKRTAKVSANREIALLSHLWNWARQRGLTDRPNPCTGVDKNKETARERYVTDDEYRAVYKRADQTLKDAMDLAYLTGQRPSDVLKMTRQDIRDGCLWVRQDKTKAKLRIEVTGELKAVIDRVSKREVPSMFLVADESGQRVTIWSLDKRFAKAKGDADWQFRDIRAKAATDSETLKGAQQLLGHASETTTADVYRRVKGDRVKPLR